MFLDQQIRRFVTILIVGCGVIPSFALPNSPNKAIKVYFYSEQIELQYHPLSIHVSDPQVKDYALEAFYKKLKGEYSIHLLVEEFLEIKHRYQLNDWLYFDFIKRSIKKLFPNQSELTQELCCWVILSESGFDTRLTYLNNQVFIYALTFDEIFEVPTIEVGGQTFANLSSAYAGHSKQQDLYLLDFRPQEHGGSFSFILEELPLLEPKLSSRQIEFIYDRQRYTLDVTIDETLIFLMNSYPGISEYAYMKVPPSTQLASTLLPSLRKMLAGRPKYEQLEMLVAFTRSAFSYQDDLDYFGFSKPMIAEELFYYDSSDCEDRCALFYLLVKELLHLPMAIIAYNDHITIGVAFEENIGDYIEYNGRTFYICDPTGPINSSAIGVFPNGYEEASFEILGTYN